MAPGAHLLISWLTTIEVFKARRERVLVTLTGLAPDLDGTGLLIDYLTGTTHYYFKYHHYLGHSIFSAMLFATIATILAKSQKVQVWCVSFVVIHLHFFCDLIGSKGPDGYHWPVYYFYPFSHHGFTWGGQWALNAWQNQLILLLLLVLCLYYLTVKNITFLEVFSKQLDQAAVGMYERLKDRKIK